MAAGGGLTDRGESGMRLQCKGWLDVPFADIWKTREQQVFVRGRIKYSLWGMLSLRWCLDIGMGTASRQKAVRCRAQRRGWGWRENLGRRVDVL